MLRKSSVSPPGTRSRCHVLPTSFDCKITPFDPEAQTTGAGAGRESVNSAMLTARRFVSIPLLCTVQNGGSLTPAARKIAAATTTKRGISNCARRLRISRILAAVRPNGGTMGPGESLFPQRTQLARLQSFLAALALILRQHRQHHAAHRGRIVPQLGIQQRFVWPLP